MALGRASECVLLLLGVAVCVSGIQYEIYEEPSTWKDARATCERDYKRLVHVTEELKHLRIRNFRQFVHFDFWIGLKESDTGSVYEWTDNSVAEFTAWGQGQPSAQDECVRYHANGFTWETHNCTAMLYFMCETYGLPGENPQLSGIKTAVAGFGIGLISMVGLLVIGLLFVVMPCCRGKTKAIEDW